MTESYKEWCSGKSHVEVIAEVQRAIRALLQDPLLNDLSPTVTPEEINSKLALAQGRALSLWLRVYDDHNIPLVVLQGCTVQSLMQAVERNVMRRVKPSTVISWAYVWRTHWLACRQVRLEDKYARLDKYGISNHAELRFVKKTKKNS